MNTPVVVTPPAFSPITTQDAKDHLRVRHNLDDALIDRFVLAAVDRAQHRTGRQLAQAQFRWTLPGFPPGREIKIPYAPLVSIDSVTYLDADEASQPLDPGDFRVLTDDLPGSLWRTADSWPVTSSKCAPDTVTITYTAGHMALITDPIPEELKAGILAAVWHMYDHRGEISTDGISVIPHSVEAIFESWNIGDEFTKYGQLHATSL